MEKEDFSRFWEFFLTGRWLFGKNGVYKAGELLLFR
jgi:hypothetical protein